MQKLTRPQSTTASLAHRLILLVLVAGVLDPGPGRDRQVAQGIEVLFRASSLHSPGYVTHISLKHNGIKDFHDLAVYTGQDWQYGTLRPKHTIGQVNARPLSHPCIVTASCNIPHQNADEDEAFVYLSAVA
jgi:hypothetical protein